MRIVASCAVLHDSFCYKYLFKHLHTVLYDVILYIHQQSAITEPLQFDLYINIINFPTSSLNFNYTCSYSLSIHVVIVN